MVLIQMLSTSSSLGHGELRNEPNKAISHKLVTSFTKFLFLIPILDIQHVQYWVFYQLRHLIFIIFAMHASKNQIQIFSTLQRMYNRMHSDVEVFCEIHICRNNSGNLSFEGLFSIVQTINSWAHISGYIPIPLICSLRPTFPEIE